jgi:predicted nucleic acid-binding protein
LKIVIDANVAVSLVLDPDRAIVIAEHWRAWEQANATLHAPSLFRYEVASALTRGIVSNELTPDDADFAWDRIVRMPIVLHELHDGRAAVALARQLRRHSAYDASYVVLAQQLESEVWTLDGPLARNAAGTGLPVRLIDVASSRRT